MRHLTTAAAQVRSCGSFITGSGLDQVRLRSTQAQVKRMYPQIVAALVQRQHMHMVLACARLCSGRRGWMAGGLLLELSLKHKFLVQTFLSLDLIAILTG